jgi:hypothetical protein
MKLARLPLWPFWVASAIAGLLAAFLYVAAVSTASLRYGYCGPAVADAPEQYCRVAVRVLHQSYAVGLLAAVLVVLATLLTLKGRKRGVEA